MELLVDGAVIGTLLNGGCNPEACTVGVPWSSSAQTLEVKASSSNRARSTHMQIQSMVFQQGAEQYCVADSCTDSIADCVDKSDASQGKLSVHSVCLPENLQGPTVNNLPMRSPLMYRHAPPLGRG